MKWWPWRREEPVRSMPPVLDDQDTAENLRRAKDALATARRAHEAAKVRRPEVVAAGRELAKQNSRNHFAELVRSALGQGR